LIDAKYITMHCMHGNGQILVSFSMKQGYIFFSLSP